MGERSHEIATEAARVIVSRSVENGIGWTEVALAMETTLAIVIVSCAAMAETRNPVAFAQEIIEAVTERAHQRARDLLLKEPPHA